MFRGFLAVVERLVLGRPRLVVALALGLSVVALVLGSQVEFRTSRADLAPPDDPDQLRWDRLVEEYKASSAVIAAVERSPGESGPAAELHAFADRLAAALESDGLVQEVFHRIDVDWLLRHGLHLADPERLAAAASAIGGDPALLRGLGDASDLARWNEALAAALDRRIASGSASPGDGAHEGLSALVSLVTAERRFAEDPVGSVESWTGRPPLLALAGERGQRLADGYLATRDGETLFLLVTPVNTADDLETRRALVKRMRAIAGETASGRPGFHVAFTGTAAMAVEEMDTVRRDTLLTSVVAVLGVSLLTLLVFRWRTHALLVLAALAAGLMWAFGAVKIELGYLNLITSAFVSTLAGVGVAYGIHPVAEYELVGAHTENPLEAVRQAYRRTSAAVSAAAFTTAVAFFSILLMRFRGFDELGLVAGVGVLLCLASMVLFLPALLVVYGHWRGSRDRAPRHGRALDRLGFERVVGKVCRYPLPVTFVAAALTVALGWAAMGIGFNANMLDLLPRDAESLRYQRKMVLESDLSPVSNMVVADDLAELAVLRERAAAEPAIERFESALGLLPSDPAASDRAVKALGVVLGRMRLPQLTTPLDPSRLARSFERLSAVTGRAAEAAFASGLGQVAADLDEAAEQARLAAEAARGATPETVRQWNDAQVELLAWVHHAVDRLEQATATEPPTPETLPDGLRERFFTDSGKPLGFLFPEGSVFETETLDAYVGASRRVSAGAIGFPLLLHKASRRITRGFYRAVVAGAVLVFLTLLVDLRSLRYALLAMVPLAMGVVWTMAGMHLLGLSFNFANLVAVPLIIGVGIDNGVHVIHRIRLEGERGMGVVLRHTGRAILIASLTTMIGFGSLALASHRGLASLGVALLLGVGSCLITSIVVLPNLLVVLGVVRR